MRVCWSYSCYKLVINIFVCFLILINILKIRKVYIEAVILRTIVAGQLACISKLIANDDQENNDI